MKTKHAKVYEVPDTKAGKTYTYFCVSFYDATGKRCRKTFSDKSAAFRFASCIDTEAINRGAERRMLSTVLDEAKLRRLEIAVERLGDRYDLDAAIDFFLKHHQNPDFKISVRDAADKFLDFQKSQVRPKSLGEFRGTLRGFAAYTNNPFVHEVTHEIVENYLESLRGRNGVDKAAPKTWNNILKGLHRFFGWCVEKPQRFIEINPTADVKTMRIDRGDIHTLSSEKAGELMRFVETFEGGKLVRYFALAMFAGIRPEGELTRLDDSGSLNNSVNGVIRLTAAMTKTGEPRQINIQPNLRQWLTKFQGPIFPKNAAKDITAIRKQFGLVGSTAHDILRHTFISNHVQAFDSLAQTALQAGNSEAIIRKHYFNVTSKDEALKFWQISPAA